MGSTTSKIGDVQRYGLRAYAAGVALSLGAMGLLFSSANHAAGDETLQALLKGNPLAEVGVQELSPAEQSVSMTENVALTMSLAPSEDPLAVYARNQDEEWAIPEHVDRQDPWVRLLLLLPSRPVVVHIAVELEGQPFRAAREKWIDALISGVQDAMLIRDGLKAVDTAKG